MTQSSLFRNANAYTLSPISIPRYAFPLRPLTSFDLRPQVQDLTWPKPYISPSQAPLPLTLSDSNPCPTLSQHEEPANLLTINLIVTNLLSKLLAPELFIKQHFILAALSPTRTLFFPSDPHQPEHSEDLGHKRLGRKA